MVVRQLVADEGFVVDESAISDLGRFSGKFDDRFAGVACRLFYETIGKDTRWLIRCPCLGKSMKFAIAVPFLFLALGLVSLATPPFPSQELSTVEQLQRDRIEVLEKRCQLAQTQIDEDRSGFEVMIEPKIDLLNAKIEYAANAKDKVAYYNELIKLYEELVEREEMRLQEPRRIDGEQVGSETQPLFYESEKIRIQIEKAKLFAEK